MTPEEHITTPEEHITTPEEQITWTIATLLDTVSLEGWPRTRQTDLLALLVQLRQQWEAFQARTLQALDAVPPESYREQTSRLGKADGCQPEPLPPWFPEVLPSGWTEHPAPYGWDRPYNRVYERHGTVRVLVSCARYGDGKRWLHVSVARRNGQLPEWELMCTIKNLFLGEDRTAYQIHPPRAQYVNNNAGVLHLWTCLDGDVTPDFTAGGATI